MKSGLGAGREPGKVSTGPTGGADVDPVGASPAATWSLVRPVLTERGKASIVQPATHAASRFLISSHSSRSPPSASGPWPLPSAGPLEAPRLPTAPPLPAAPLWRPFPPLVRTMV